MTKLLTTDRDLHIIASALTFTANEVTEAQYENLHETMLSLSEVLTIHLNHASVEVLNIEHESSDGSLYTVVIWYHETFIFEGHKSGAFVAAFKFTSRTDALECAYQTATALTDQQNA